MRPGGARSGSDDGLKRRSRSSPALDVVLDFGRDRQFRNSRANSAKRSSKHRTDDVRCLLNRAQFGSVLDCPKLFDRAPVIRPPHPGSRSSFERLFLGHRDLTRGIADPGAPFAGPQSLSRGTEQPVLADLHACARHLFPRLKCIPAVREKYRRGRIHQ